MMAGWTGFTTGNLNNRSCYIPLSDVIKGNARLSPSDRKWQRLLAGTGQPSFINEETQEAVDYETKNPPKEKVKATVL